MIQKQTKTTVVHINKTKSCFFERFNKYDKLLAKLIKKKKDPNKIKNEREEITTNTT